MPDSGRENLVHGSELAVAAVTKWRIGRVFAAAEEQFFGGLRGVFDRLKGTSLVRAIAERLLAGFATGTPEIALPLGYFDWEGGFLGDIGGVGHGLGVSLAGLGCFSLAMWGRFVKSGVLVFVALGGRGGAGFAGLGCIVGHSKVHSCETLDGSSDA